MVEVNTLFVIPRVHPKHGPVLFIPNLPAKSGYVACYTKQDQHSEASTGYYKETGPARNDACAALLREYNALPPNDVIVEIRQRLSMAMLRKSWPKR